MNCGANLWDRWSAGFASLFEKCACLQPFGADLPDCHVGSSTDTLNATKQQCEAEFCSFTTAASFCWCNNIPCQSEWGSLTLKEKCTCTRNQDLLASSNCRFHGDRSWSESERLQDVLDDCEASSYWVNHTKYCKSYNIM